MIDRKLASVLACGVCAIAIATPASAQTRMYHIPSGSLKSALDSFGRQSGRPIIYQAEQVRGARSAGVSGELSAEDALKAILTGTFFHAQMDTSGAIAIVRVGNGTPVGSLPKSEDAEHPVPTDQADAGGIAANSDIVVTGSRIKGAPPASPLITITQKQMRENGQNTLEDVIRSIPQNFSGGQNPGVQPNSSVANINNQNITGGSSLNLRGIGADATLTLINGRRPSYDSFTQAVDISVIPVAAVDRVEIVADGASAIYGSDAVAGVANVILRRDFSGITTTARVGTSTDGGDLQQEYTGVGGYKWNTGGFIATYDHERDTGVDASQRSYTKGLLAPNTLLPSKVSDAVVVSGHQDLAAGLTLGLDGFYSKRTSSSRSTSIYGTSSSSSQNSTNYSIAPNISGQLGQGWTFKASALYGRDRAITHYAQNRIQDGSLVFRTDQCQCNSVLELDASIDGSLFELPGGKAQVAFGGGYLKNRYDQIYYTSQGNPTTGTRESYNAYGEVYFPLISSGQGLTLMRRLSLTAAARYEHYSDLGSITTPKVGLIYSPISGLVLKGSWGKSFKAPTLVEEYSAPTAYLLPAYVLGAQGLPNSATAIFISGGNKALKPERSDSYTITAEIDPAPIAGLHFEASYFKIRYRDRVAYPVALIGNAFTDPTYRQFLVLNPSVADQQSIANQAAATGGIVNATGAAYDPSNVAAIVNDLYTNITIQRIDGIDLFSRYTTQFAHGTLNLTINASRLSLRQITVPGSSTLQLSGTAFNPPHFRGRIGGSWSRGGLTLSTFANYLGGVLNTTVQPAATGSAMTTADATLIYHFDGKTGLANGLDLSLEIINIGNSKPPFLRSLTPNTPQYDSTNYSVLGRFVGATISKHW